MSDTEVLDALRGAWETISSDGANKTAPGSFKGNGARANRGSESREIHFADGEQYLAYLREFGRGSMYDAMIGHVRGMARDIGLVERYGPNPNSQARLQIDIAKIKHWEKFYWQTCTRLATMSEDDRRFIAHEIGQSTNIDVVSNGVDVEWFAQKARREPATPTLLSVGTFHWLPNVEAVRHLVQHIWPLVKQQQPQAKLWIVGNGPTPEVRKYESLDPHIEVTGGIPDIRDAFTQAHVLVASVLSGKGTRYKVLEAMASGTPIVATPTAVEGLGVVHGEQVLLGNTAEELAAHVLRVISDPQLRQHLAVAGLQFVRERYDWQGIAQSLDRVYERMAAHPQVSMQVT
jgi:glycosyltransferase involved in cell wall biosynthesis